MEKSKKEIGRFALAIQLLQGEENLDSKVSSYDFNMPKEMLITQLRTFVKMLEENYYPEFKGNITSIKDNSED